MRMCCPFAIVRQETRFNFIIMIGFNFHCITVYFMLYRVLHVLPLGVINDDVDDDDDENYFAVCFLPTM